MLLEHLLGRQTMTDARHVIGVGDAAVDHRPVLAGHVRFACSLKEQLDFQPKEAYA